MSFIRQPLLPAFLTLVVLAATAVFGSRNLAALPQEGVPSVLAGALAAFGTLYPVWAKIAAFLAIVASGTCLGRMASRYNLYSGNCYLTMPLFGLIVCGVFPESASLTRYVVVLLFSWATYRLCCSQRNGYSFGNLFRASLFAGLMPLLEAPAIGCVLMIPLALVIFKRTAREVVVALCGLLLPLFALCYLTWAMDGEFLAPITTFTDVLMTQAGHSHFALNLGSAFFPGFVLLLTLCALLLHATGVYLIQQKGRMIVLFYILLLPLIGALWLIPSASAANFALAAVPAAILLPLFFVRIRLFVAIPFYLVLLLLGIGSMLFFML